MNPISGVRLPALRAQAREKLHALPCVPGPSEIEWTALVMAETQLASATPTPATKEQGWLSARAAAAGMLSPALAAVLAEVDPKSLMPFEEVQGGNRMRLIGRGLDTLTKANRAAGLVDTSRQGFQLLGVHNPAEKKALEGALDVLAGRIGLDRLKAVADRFELSTVLGQLGDREHPRNVAGLAGGRTVALDRSLLADPKLLQVKLDHEVGHLVDQHLASRGQLWRSHEPGSPFGGPGHVSEYAALNAHEDFAETHALVLERWDALRQDPTLEVFARGKVGEKMAWILEHAYDIRLGDPPAAVNDTLKLVEEGQSPFGWRDASGTLHGAQEAYQGELQAWRQDPVAFLAPDHPRHEQRQWLVEALREGRPQARPVPQEEGAFDALMTTRRLEHDPAQNWTLIGAGQQEARDELSQALTCGGRSLYQALQKRVDALPTPSERDRMSYRLDRCWNTLRTTGAAPADAGLPSSLGY